MNRLITILALVLCAFSLHAQSYSDSKEYFYGSQAGVKAFERPPIWPGCNFKNIHKLRRCFDESLSEHIAANFKIPYDLMEKLEYKKVTVNFYIQKDGSIRIRSIKGGIPEIKELAKKVILSIPEIKPGELGGKKVAAEYTIPITY
ncbi:hypothetical protein [uncultured Dokdonia sp.]|uniref:hypothetical protein n=1 Tax=uncultured Dokdonia sp. TaxID=575653 RepID=UPI002635355E|nr:hypothetical protein [uncultured Dokdonia sp.]